MRSVLTEVLEPILYAERLVVNYQKSVKTHSLVSSTETKRQMDILEACRFDYDIQFTDVRTFRLKICFFLLKKGDNAVTHNEKNKYNFKYIHVLEYNLLVICHMTKTTTIYTVTSTRHTFFWTCFTRKKIQTYMVKIV